MKTTVMFFAATALVGASTLSASATQAQDVATPAVATIGDWVWFADVNPKIVEFFQRMDGDNQQEVSWANETLNKLRSLDCRLQQAEWLCPVSAVPALQAIQPPQVTKSGSDLVKKLPLDPVAKPAPDPVIITKEDKRSWNMSDSGGGGNLQCTIYTVDDKGLHKMEMEANLDFSNQTLSMTYRGATQTNPIQGGNATAESSVITAEDKTLMTLFRDGQNYRIEYTEGRGDCTPKGRQTEAPSQDHWWMTQGNQCVVAPESPASAAERFAKSMQEYNAQIGVYQNSGPLDPSAIIGDLGSLVAVSMPGNLAFGMQKAYQQVMGPQMLTVANGQPGADTIIAQATQMDPKQVENLRRYYRQIMGPLGNKMLSIPGQFSFYRTEETCKARVTFLTKIVPEAAVKEHDDTVQKQSQKLNKYR
jgi:hypothetical protein